MDPRVPRGFAARQSALALIGAEHVAFDGALASLVDQIAVVRSHRLPIDTGLFARSLAYLATFMERFHHPKEDEYLFRAVRKRTGEADEVLAGLQRDHAHGPADYRGLHAALEGARSGSREAFEGFASRLERYAREQLEHMRIEKESLIPIAERVLRASDWLAIDQAFRDHRDPLFGAGGGLPTVFPQGPSRS